MAYKFSKGTRGLGDITFEEDPDTGRRKVVVKRGAIVFASGYENLGYK